MLANELASQTHECVVIIGLDDNMCFARHPTIAQNNVDLNMRFKLQEIHFH